MDLFSGCLGGHFLKAKVPNGNAAIWRQPPRACKLLRRLGTQEVVESTDSGSSRSDDASSDDSCENSQGSAAPFLTRALHSFKSFLLLYQLFFVFSCVALYLVVESSTDEEQCLFDSTSADVPKVQKPITEAIIVSSGRDSPPKRARTALDRRTKRFRKPMMTGRQDSHKKAPAFAHLAAYSDHSGLPCSPLTPLGPQTPPGSPPGPQTPPGSPPSGPYTPPGSPPPSPRTPPGCPPE